MKTLLQVKRIITASLFLCAVLTTAHAGIYTWSAPVTITTADATLNQAGTVVGAAVFGTTEEVVILTNNTAFDFKADGSVATATGNGAFVGAFAGNTGNRQFNDVLTQAEYDGGPKTITLYNLVVGQQYSVQLFALDTRGGASSSATGNFQDPNDATDVSATFTMGSTVYVIGTFTANSSTMSIQENLLNGSGGGNMNALVLRNLSASVLPPQLVAQPQSITCSSTLTVQLNSAAYGTAPLSYRWQAGAVGSGVFTNLNDGEQISGSTNLTLTIINVNTNNTADYQVVVSNSAGSVTSAPPATLTVTSHIATFIWSAPVAITTADSTLDQSGTVVGAEVFGSAEELVTLTNNTTIDFKVDGSVAAITAGSSPNTASGAFSGDTGNANFNYALTQFNYDNGPKTITISNLVVGKQYSVELFALDQRGGSSSGVQANFQDPNDASDISSTFAMGDTVYVIGTFTATNTTIAIQENLPDSGGGDMNALVLRNLSAVSIAPQIVYEPQSLTAPVGQTVPITVAAYGTALNYQWQAGAVGSGVFTNLTNGGQFSGANGPTLTITNLQSSNGADYRVIVSNTSGSVTSAPPATLTVLANNLYAWSTPVAITTADATLTQSGTVVGAEVFGSTEEIVALDNSTVIDFKADNSVAAVTAGSSTGTATGAFSGNTGNANFNAALTQFNYDNGPKTITLYNLVVGQQYSVQLFALDQRGSTVRASFQDPNNSFDVSSTIHMNAAVYVLGTFTANNTTMAIQENLPDNGGGNINALVIRNLSASSLIPIFSAQPSSGTSESGLTVQLSAAAYGTAPLIYQWQAGAVGSGVFTNLSNGGQFLGVNSSTLTISSLQMDNMADYRVIASNGSGSATSSTATLTVTTNMALYDWSVPVAVTTADATLNQPGGIVGAAVFGGVETTVTLSDGTNIVFTADGSVASATGNGTFLTAFNGNTGNSNFNTVLAEAEYDGGPKLITLNNLTVGQKYSVQLFAMDTRGGGASSRQANFQDPNDALDISSTFTMGEADYIIGTFTANSSTMYIEENLLEGGGGNINALVIRQAPFTAVAATLAHRWSFNETSGTTAHDSVGGANGTLMGNAYFAGGYAVLPNSGSPNDSSYVSIPGGLLNNLSSVSVECWVTNNGWANGNTFVGFGGQWNTNGSGTNFISFFARWYNAISAFQIQTTDGDSGIVDLGTRVNYNSIDINPSPAHYVYTYDPVAGNIMLYTNGVLSGWATGVTIPLSTLGTNLGTIGLAIWNTNYAAPIPNTSGNRPFMSAGVSEVRIYDGILSGSQIAADYQLGPDQLLPNTTTNSPAIRVTPGIGHFIISWPAVNGGFYVESSPVLGPNAVWTPVSGTQIVVGPNYQMTIPTTNGATIFFRLRNE